MEFRAVQAKRGPSVWGSLTVIEATLDHNDLPNTQSHELPGFVERLLSWLPALADHRCANCPDSQFGRRLAQGVHIAHVIERVAVEIQSQAGNPLPFSRTADGDEPGVTRIILQYEEEDVGKAAMRAALEVVAAAIADGPMDVHATIEKVRALNYDISLGPSTRSIVQAAAVRGVPFKRMTRVAWFGLAGVASNDGSGRRKPIARRRWRNISHRTRS